MSTVTAMVQASSNARPDVEPLTTEPDQLVVTQRAQPGRRFIAAWAYDYLACFWLSLSVWGILNLIGGSALTQRVPLLVVTILIYLTRDFFFEGRGVGKNFLGLQVLDLQSGRPASLVQSLIRNFVLLGPFLIYQLAVAVGSFLPVTIGTSIVFTVKCAALIYAAILLPLEGYRMHTGNGLRIADKLAGTAVVVQTPSFRNPFSLPRTTSSAHDR
jgi:uncharacterized membrane protein